MQGFAKDFLARKSNYQKKSSLAFVGKGPQSQDITRTNCVSGRAARMPGGLWGGAKGGKQVTRLKTIAHAPFGREQTSNEVS